MRSSTAVCSACAGARWVCLNDPTRPWHFGGCGDGAGQPCPACNHGPDFHAWHQACLRCATLEEFMSTIEPDDDDGVLAGLFSQLGDLEEPEGVVDFTKLTNAEVSERYTNVREQLLAMGEMLTDIRPDHRSTPEARELHSQRAALLIEMSKRNMR